MTIERTETVMEFGVLARECLEAALYSLASNAADIEVLGNAELGLLALRRHYGSTDPITLNPADLLDDITPVRPACTCPPGMVEQGGFRSSCPAHGRLT